MSRHICIYYFIPSSQLSGKIGIILIPILQFLKTLKSLLQQHISKASIIWQPAFFILQLSHPYTTTGKTIALTRWTFVGRVLSVLFNMLSRLAIAFLTRGKCLLISWLQSPCAMILEARKIKSVTVSIVSPSICHEVMGGIKIARRNNNLRYEDDITLMAESEEVLL